MLAVDSCVAISLRLHLLQGIRFLDCDPDSVDWVIVWRVRVQCMLFASLKVEICNYSAFKRLEDVSKVFLSQIEEVKTAGVACAARMKVGLPWQLLSLRSRSIAVLICDLQVAVANLERSLFLILLI